MSARVKGSELELSQRYGYGWYCSFHVNGENVEAIKKAVDEYKGKDIAADIGKWSNPRSLTANAYFHVLVGKIAEAQKLGISQGNTRTDGTNKTFTTRKDAHYEALQRVRQRPLLRTRRRKVPV